MACDNAEQKSVGPVMNKKEVHPVTYDQNFGVILRPPLQSPALSPDVVLFPEEYHHVMTVSYINLDIFSLTGLKNAFCYCLDFHVTKWSGY
jgi:hypothetical protein